MHLLFVTYRLAVAVCLLSGYLGCAARRPSEAYASGNLRTTTLHVSLTGDGAEFAAGGPAMEVLVDGERLTNRQGEGAESADLAPIELAVGEHTIESRVKLLTADGKSRVTIGSFERIEVRDATASVKIDVVLTKEDHSAAHGVEIRYGGERVRFVRGSLPTEIARGEPPTPSLPAALGVVADDELPLRKADRLVRSMAETRGEVLSRVSVARSRRDVVVALCESDKLGQIDVALSSAGARRASVAGAVVKADDDVAAHELMILTVLSQRVAQLGAESEQCVGEEAAVAPSADRRDAIDTPRFESSP